MKTVFVTGASRGIGKSIALELGKDYQVIVGFSNSKDKAHEVAEEIKKLGGESLAVQLNIADRNSVDEAFNLIEKTYKNVDILVNNAGITKDNIIPRMKDDKLNDVIKTNIIGNFDTSQRSIKKMIKNKWGRLIFISSVVGISGNQGQANYAASKGGLLALTKSLAKEVGRRNITVNCIAPGLIETDMTSHLSDTVKQGYLDRIPLKKLGKPKDIGQMILFLCSDEASYITGQTISIDGGMSI